MSITLMETWRDEYFKERGTTYQNHVNKFIVYLLHIKKADTPNKITLDDVDECVGYYAKLGKINACSSMESHLESVKSFYDYLLAKGKTGDIFAQMFYDDFKKNIVEKYQLDEKVERERFEFDIIKDMLTILDDYLECNNYFELEGVKPKDKYIRQTTLRLFIKLTLVAPTKRKNICALKFSDFSENFRTLMINAVKVNIPNGLHRDIIKAIKLKKSIDGRGLVANELMFKYIAGENFKNEQLNQWFCSFLKEYEILEIPNEKDSFSVEAIMNTAVFDMVTRLANPAFISKINGVKIASIEEKYYSGNGGVMKQEITIDDAINWEISKSGYYSYI